MKQRSPFSIFPGGRVQHSIFRGPCKRECPPEFEWLRPWELSVLAVSIVKVLVSSGAVVEVVVATVRKRQQVVRICSW